MKTTMISLGFALLLLVANTGRAEPAPCADNNTTVFYLNGVLTVLDEAIANAIELQNRVEPVLPMDATACFFASWSQNQTALFDLYDVAVQQEIVDCSRFFDWLIGAESAPSAFQTAMIELVEGLDEQAYLMGPELSQFTQAYSGELLEGKRVALVPHSQGNFFANSAHGSIQSESLGIAAVATPAAAVAGGGQYTTLFSDTIISAVQSVDPLTLPATTSNNNPGDLLGHGFMDSYLDGDVSGPRIVGHVQDTIASLPIPEGVASEGIITVTLEWGDQPDVDLHVFEPNGFHVYYFDKQGVSGFLDVDDTDGMGPEHYFVNEETLEVGTYNVNVDYFFGEGPETARIQIKAGNVIRNFSTVLPSDDDTGPDNPIPVASVVVSMSQSGVYQFQVTAQ